MGARTLASLYLINRAKERDRGDFGKGFYFTPNRRYAASYALPGYWNSDGDGNKVYACFLNIRKPLQVQARHGRNMARWKLEESEGVMVYTDAYYELEWNDPKNLSEVVVQESNQIKSATDNRGTYDAGNADITFSLSTNFLILRQSVPERAKISSGMVEARLYL